MSRNATFKSAMTRAAGPKRSSLLLTVLVFVT